MLKTTTNLLCYHKLRLVAVAIILTSNLSGCMVGPDFKKPNAPNIASYNAKKLPPKTAAAKHAGKAGIAQVYAKGRDIPADWWQVFKSPEISTLIKTGIHNNLDMKSAQAALVQAQETLYAQIGNSLIPAFDGGLSAERQLFPSQSFPGSTFPPVIFNTFGTTVNVAYTLDLFGAARREIESLKAQVDYQQFQLIATYLTLSTNIVTTAINMASYQEQINATKALVKAADEQLKIIKRQYHLGGVSDAQVQAQQTLVDQTRATLPPLEYSLAQTRHALAVLIGASPNKKINPIHLDNINLPAKLPVSISSKLVRQRPDIRAAEALLHSATAQVGVATANLYPQITINGLYGWEAAMIPNLFGDATKTWDLIGQLTQPLFHGGALLAERRAALAALDQAAAQYKQTVLQAFQNVADTLRALETDARAFRDQKSAERAALKAYNITSAQYRVGGVSYADLLAAQQQYQQTRLSSIQAQTARYADTAALYQALGGGWWNRPSSRCDAVNRLNASLKCP